MATAIFMSVQTNPLVFDLQRLLSRAWVFCGNAQNAVTGRTNGDGHSTSRTRTCSPCQPARSVTSLCFAYRQAERNLARVNALARSIVSVRVFNRAWFPSAGSESGEGRRLGLLGVGRTCHATAARQRGLWGSRILWFLIRGKEGSQLKYVAGPVFCIVRFRPGFRHARQ